MSTRPIFLVGMMGAGKTTIGKRLARQLECEFADIDQKIEKSTGVSVSTIFELEGEAGFRKRESAFVRQLVDDGIPRVIATGGGAILNPMNRAIMAAHGFVVYLHASPELIAVRTRHDKSRPLLQVSDPLARIHTLLVQRDPLYRECANLTVQSGTGIQSLISDIQRGLPAICKH